MKYLFVFLFQVSLQWIKLHHSPHSRTREQRANCHIEQMWACAGDFSVLTEQNLAKYYLFVMQWDNSYSLSLSYLVKGESFVKIQYYAPFRGGNCCWGTVSTSPVMYILYCSLKQETQSYDIWLRSPNFLKDTATRSSWNTFENKNGSRHNILPY